ncbi:possible transcriptional regulator, GntR family (plasmid) [Rhodococcus jostii RHA1]|uniref:Possible transcriptional regulator, GntR family n=1 Tax=Rhodococcus jostii (strain RHA1) TaxID=101510 RepID=Q0RW19_RHOJR|nr:GntR family transcriptional regulator [Rhodococcus jostii]ABH00517.1 possible transcriptional regulator, GntR family [Rhodococcus jostii RHA1]
MSTGTRQTQIPAAPVPPRTEGERKRKLAAVLAQRLEADIAAAGWRVGEVFASEENLCSRYDVSRGALREAIRLLEHRGVVRTRRSSPGGLVVQAPDAHPLARAMAVYLEFVGANVADLLRARVLLEPAAARLASERLTEDGINHLRASLRREQEAEGFDSTGHERLHIVLADHCGSAVLTLFVDVLVQLTINYAQVPTLPIDRKLQDLKSESDHAHKAIVDAIVSGDHVLAQHRSVRHLRAVNAWLLSVQQRPIDRGSSSPAPLPPTAKLAETVAHRLMTDIVTSGMQAGQIFGSESELQARSGVSRAVFREAVRLLEHHHIARMRRGPYGGLVITEPDPAASIEAAGTYLRYRGTSTDEVRQVRDILELGALAAVTERLHEPEMHERLEAAAEFCGGATADERAVIFARLADDPILELFTHILLAAEGLDAVPVADDRDGQDAHASVLSALLNGDSALARHRLGRHLRRPPTVQGV